MIRWAARWRDWLQVVACGVVGVIVATSAWAGEAVVKFGVDPRYSPRELFERYQPFLDYLHETTGYQFQLHLAKSYEEGIRDLGTGMVHIGSYGAVSYLVAQARHGDLRPILRGVGRDGGGRYRAAIVTREERGIRDLRELRGRSFAFGSRLSTQGYLMPRAMLEGAGITIADLKATAYLGSHTSVARAVLLGQYDAGAVSDIKAREYAELGLRVIALSDPVATSAIVAGRAADPRMVEAVRQACRGLDPNGAHRALMKSWDPELAYGIIDARDGDYAGLRDLVKRFGLLEPREATQ